MKEKKNDLTLKELISISNKTAEVHGWWEDKTQPPRKYPECLMLVVSELSEALEEYRVQNPTIWVKCEGSPDGMCSRFYRLDKYVCPYDAKHVCKNWKKCGADYQFNPKMKLEGFTTEIADAIIRICDMAGHFHLPLEEALRYKMAYNATRPYRHGDKVC